MIESEKKKRKKIASIYDIAENVEKENAENSDDAEEEKVAKGDVDDDLRKDRMTDRHAKIGNMHADANANVTAVD